MDYGASVFTYITLVMSFVRQRERYTMYLLCILGMRKECDSAILDVARCLGVPRRALGLSASPRGKFVVLHDDSINYFIPLWFD
jgi:hypothetical protein